MTALIGSMDIEPLRWDTAQHDPCHEHKHPQRRSYGILPDSHYLSWHGEMFLVEGSAAVDIERTFWQRWHDPAPPFKGVKLPQYAFTAPTVPAHRFQCGLPVQVVRTFGCPSKGAAPSAVNFWGFAQNGEFSGSELYYKAIANAKKYVLMADQFLNYPEIFTALAQVLPRLERVVLVTNRAWTNNVFNTRMQHMQFLAMKPLLQSVHAHKLSIFTLTTQSLGCRRVLAGEYQIYMHAKTVLVDDEFLLAGSMGLERAGFTNDHDISIGLHSHEFAAAYRRMLSAEYLQLNESDPLLHSYRSDFAEWDRQATRADAQLIQQPGVRGRYRLRHYRPKSLGFLKTVGAANFYNWYEPDGRC